MKHLKNYNTTKIILFKITGSDNYNDDRESFMMSPYDFIMVIESIIAKNETSTPNQHFFKNIKTSKH